MERPQEHKSLEDWQVAEVVRGFGEADRGDFATDEEVQCTIAKWALPSDSAKQLKA